MTEIGGLGGVRWEDQQTIRSKVEGVVTEATDGPSGLIDWYNLLVKIINFYLIEQRGPRTRAANRQRKSRKIHSRKL